MLQLSTWSLLTPQWGGSLLTVNTKVLSLHEATFSQILIAAGRDEKPAPCWQAVKVGHTCTASGGWKSRLATQPFQAWVWSIPSFFLCCLARVEAAIYTFYVLLGCPFPGPLDREGWLLLGLFVCTHWHFWVFIFFSSKLTYIRQE